MSPDGKMPSTLRLLSLRIGRDPNGITEDLDAHAEAWERDLADVDRFRALVRKHGDERDALARRLESMIVRDHDGQHVSQGAFNGIVGEHARFRSEVVRVDAERNNDQYALIKERDRLADILACERGERAPVGWVWTTYAIGDGNTHGEWQRRAPGIVLALSVWRGKEGTWHWQVHPPGGTQQGVAPTALEAIEAADLAAGGKS